MVKAKWVRDIGQWDLFFPWSERVKRLAEMNIVPGPIKDIDP